MRISLLRRCWWAIEDWLHGCHGGHHRKLESDGRFLYWRCAICGLRTEPFVEEAPRPVFIGPEPKTSHRSVLPFRRSA